MWLGLITLFPEMFKAVTESGITARAVKNGLLTVASWNPRDYADDGYKRVDDRPYGGGPGMVMLIEPLRQAIAAARAEAASQGVQPVVIYLSPQGRRLDQAGVKELAAGQAYILLCGRYEGIDERVRSMPNGRLVTMCCRAASCPPWC